jgi:hypothetical protein
LGICYLLKRAAYIYFLEGDTTRAEIYFMTCSAKMDNTSNTSNSFSALKNLALLYLQYDLKKAKEIFEMMAKFKPE